MANDVYEILRGISQASVKLYDGATDENGDPVKIGLNREKGNYINQSRAGLMDGCKIKMVGDKLYVNYQAEAPMRHIHRQGPEKYEADIEQIFGDIAKFLKKEYKKITGSALTLKEEGPCDVLLQYMNRKRSWIEATKIYVIGNLKNKAESPEKEPFDGVANFIKVAKYDKFNY